MKQRERKVGRPVLDSLTGDPDEIDHVHEHENRRKPETDADNWVNNELPEIQKPRGLIVPYVVYPNHTEDEWEKTQSNERQPPNLCITNLARDRFRLRRFRHVVRQVFTHGMSRTMPMQLWFGRADGSLQRNPPEKIALMSASIGIATHTAPPVIKP